LPEEGSKFKTQATHILKQQASDFLCRIFNSYLEVAIDRNNRAGHTETVETAFLQVMKGHTGMMAKLLSFNEDWLLCSIPIVVTTAELFRVRFHAGNVPLKTGKIEAGDVTVDPIDFCAVNYHPNDELSVKSQFTSMQRESVRSDLMYWQRRTIFVVQGEKVRGFLGWLNEFRPSHNS
jgi:hypothetical protein